MVFEESRGIARGLQEGSLTQRAADGGYAPRFLSFFLALGVSPFRRRIHPPPTAANAHR